MLRTLKTNLGLLQCHFLFKQTTSYRQAAETGAAVSEQTTFIERRWGEALDVADLALVSALGRTKVRTTAASNAHKCESITKGKSISEKDARRLSGGWGRGYRPRKWRRTSVFHLPSESWTSAFASVSQYVHLESAGARRAYGVDNACFRRYTRLYEGLMWQLQMMAPICGTIAHVQGNILNVHFHAY